MNAKVAVLGLTASGKSELAMCLARHYKAEILSVDSMQVYIGMDIGTAKPSPAEQAQIPHHLIDLVTPDVDYTAAQYQTAGRAVMSRQHDQGTRLLLVGGSGLYYRALVDPYQFTPSDPAVREQVEQKSDQEVVAQLLQADPQAGEHVDLANPRRTRRALEVINLGGPVPSRRAEEKAARQVRQYHGQEPTLAFGLDPGPRLVARVEQRVDRMLAAGLVEEVATLGPKLGRNASQAVGYKQLLPVVRGETSLEEGRQRTITATLALARRQRTFFKKDPRIRWLPWDDQPDRICHIVRQKIEENQTWNS